MLSSTIGADSAIAFLSWLTGIFSALSIGLLAVYFRKKIIQIEQNHQQDLQQREAELNQRNWDLESNVQQRTIELRRLSEQQTALSEVIGKIRSSLDLETIFKLAATEVRQLLEVDRVGIFRFYPESGYDDGEFVSEDVLPPYDSALNIRIHDHCFGDRYASRYASGQIQAVDDILNAGLSDCHIAVLSQFQIRANLIIPLLRGKFLWGLLCIHQCSAPREWQQSEIDFVKQVAVQLDVALYQAELLSQTQQKTQQLERSLQDLKQLQLHLVQNEKMSALGQLVAGVAHEINNPVNFIYGNINHVDSYTRDLLELLQPYEQYDGSARAEIQEKMESMDLDFLAQDLPKLLKSMKIGAERIREIVLSLRNFSRLDQADVKEVNIHDGLDSTLRILQHRLKPISLRFGIEVVKNYGVVPLVECLAGQLNQVFMNLLANAIDALQEFHESLPPDECLKEQGKIVITTQVIDSTWVHISIQDNGFGIPVAVQSKLFDPFFTTKPVGKGTGLGLSISYQVIERHNGTLECFSLPDRGSEFLIKIPIQQANPSARERLNLGVTLVPALLE
ncbi:MAG: GAF domain-containing sensor histidine kinase [Leptolyngbyaceae cyanobacterium CAN_BIN12]|nr:GAF domain-containing sensor histidine kinase [Leptolyngbyaceae cyanobacterium CAN_BIN12]